MEGFKAFTHDLRSPIQGSAPLWDGTTPYHLPAVTLDTSSEACGAGWNFCREQHVALRIAGLWRDGRPARLFRVVGGPDSIERGDKLRSSTLTIVDEVTDFAPAIEALSEHFDKRFRAEMIEEQLAWLSALARPCRDDQVVQDGLRSALAVRGLSSWNLRRFDSARDARAAWDAIDAWASLAAWDAREAWSAWDAREDWSAWPAWEFWAARDALIVLYTSRIGWSTRPHDLLTVGIRDAYRCGLEIALPTGPTELGWAMGEAR
jgi:hypothetical protein